MSRKSWPLDTGVGMKCLLSPEGTNLNSRGLSAAIRSEAHGSQTVPVPTLKGLNPRSMLPHRWGSTPSGSGCLYRRLPRVAPDCAPPGAISICPLRGPK